MNNGMTDFVHAISRPWHKMSYTGQSIKVEHHLLDTHQHINYLTTLGSD